MKKLITYIQLEPSVKLLGVPFSVIILSIINIKKKQIAFSCFTKKKQLLLNYAYY